MFNPVFASTVLFNLYAYIDLACVGRLGKEAVAAVGIANAVYFILYALTAAFSKSVVRFVSHKIGEKDFDGAKIVFTRALGFAALSGFVISAFFWFFSTQLILLMITDPLITGLAIAYFRILALTAILTFCSMAMMAALRADGDTKTPLKVSLVGNGLNIFFDITLIFGLIGFPRLELKGAAIATVIGRFISFLILFVLMYRGYGNIKIVRGKWRDVLDWVELKKFVIHLLPGFGEGILRGFNRFFMIKILAPFGASALSAYVVCQRIVTLVMMPSMSFAIACSSISGQFLGADMVESAKKCYRTTNLLYLPIVIIGGIFLVAIPEKLIGIFVEDPEVISVGVPFLRLMAISTLFFGQITIGSGFLNVAGMPLIPMLAALTGNYMVQIPLAYVLSRYTSLGLTGIWIADPATHIFQAMIFIIVIRSGYWLKKYRKNELLAT